MTWSYTRIDHELEATFIEEVRLQKQALRRSDNFDIFNCAQELVHNGTLENTCASIRRFAGSLMAFDELLDEDYKHLVSRLYRMTNWACHGKFEKNVKGRHEKINKRRLIFIRNVLNSIVMHLDRHRLTAPSELLPQSGDESSDVGVTMQSANFILPIIDDDDAWDIYDDVKFRFGLDWKEQEDDWRVLDCTTEIKWYKRVWYWFRTWVCFGWQSF
jgi:hypothetical protein